MDESKHGLYMVAIVGIVAVLGIVALIMGAQASANDNAGQVMRARFLAVDDGFAGDNCNSHTGSYACGQAGCTWDSQKNCCFGATSNC